MTDRNIKLHAAYTFWLDTRCQDVPISTATEYLLEDFNLCMEKTGLSTRIGKHAFELMLEYSGLKKCEKDGKVWWRGFAPADPFSTGNEIPLAFPEILR
jgi:hypothetical protein